MRFEVALGDMYIARFRKHQPRRILVDQKSETSIDKACPRGRRVHARFECVSLQSGQGDGRKA